MKKQSWQYYLHDGPTGIRFDLSGNLNHEAAIEIDQAWRTASSVLGNRIRIVDITLVTAVDEHAGSLIARWHSEGAQVIAASKPSRVLAESILGVPPATSSKSNGRESRGWFPLRAWFRASFLTLIALQMVVLADPASAKNMTLAPETIAAWDTYVQSVNSGFQERLRPGGNFLWTFEDPQRAAAIRNGEIEVAPAPGPSPRRVPGGLIHHWIGAAFIPDRKLEDILCITQDYDRYKEYYGPSVVDSKFVARQGPEDRFSMLLMNKALFLKFALDADYRSTNVRLDDHRFYSTTKTTRIQEIERYGQSDERRSPEGEGSGYIWKLCSFARMEQRDGGVYVELEALALSRDIPTAFRFAVDPIVRRVSRNSLLLSLQQTREAVVHRPQTPTVTTSTRSAAIGNP